MTLLPFRQQQGDLAIPFHFPDYLEFLDWSGRAIRADKRGHIPSDLPAILSRLRIDPLVWKQVMSPQGNHFRRAIGQIEQLRQFASRLGQSWVHGMRMSQQLYPATTCTKF